MDTFKEPTVSISLTVKDAAQALEFYRTALGAKECFRVNAPDGTVAHAEFTIGNTLLYISGEAEAWHALAMPENSMASCLFSIASKNCDASYERAVDAGAKPLSPPTDQFWGVRSSMVKDPFGYRWSFTQRIEELSEEELSKRAEKFFASMAKP
ncbi:MAG: hypothetical protein CSA20_01170 [Deltaproteobacteria bacterium]|nr:MAG: hypothetical protein CSA20_01170 [Deltaproteobacteria bacterium]